MRREMTSIMSTEEEWSRRQERPTMITRATEGAQAESQPVIGRRPGDCRMGKSRQND